VVLRYALLLVLSLPAMASFLPAALEAMQAPISEGHVAAQIMTPDFFFTRECRVACLRHFTPPGLDVHVALVCLFTLHIDLS
jgi:hypothetical protein